MRAFNTMAARRIRRKSNVKMMGVDTLLLTTVGRKSGERRTNPVGWFNGGNGDWLIVASANGATDNPAWYYNIAAHPDQVSIELNGARIAVTAAQLHGPERERAWTQITTESPRFAGYQSKTDRDIPVLRLTRAGIGG
jgi:deazaflavin-dependent oxidoreductase (nitroreductase family)